MMRKVTVSQVVFPRLALFRNEFYRGRRFVVRGNVGIRNLERAFGDIESLRFFSPTPTLPWSSSRSRISGADSEYSAAAPTSAILMISSAVKSRNPSLVRTAV
ncbi:Uncharacterised protein [Actinobacillus pleuropneumoniae]|nr:Uncharacterised protein [Actinobacillus pleuropneumoniae]